MDGGALKRCKATFAIDLHPSHSASALTGIREQLDAWLLRWNHDLGGIMLSYTNLHLQSSQARIHPYFPFFHVDVNADVDLFCPESGHTLSGRVSKIGVDYVGLLVLGVFNAAIGRQNIRSDLMYQPLAHCWASQKRPEHVIKEGSEVVFTVHMVQKEGDFFSLTGKLLSKSTGAKAYVGRLAVEDHRKSRKREIEEPPPRSYAQLEGWHLEQSTSREQLQQRPLAVVHPHVSNQQELADSAAGLSGGISLTESRRKKRRRTEADVHSTKTADVVDTGAATGMKVELSAPGHHTPVQALAAAPAVDVSVKSEPGFGQGKLSRKQLKKLGLSAPDLDAPTPVPIKAEPGTDGADLQRLDCPASAPMRGANLTGLSKKQRKKLRMSMPDPALLSRMPSDAGVGFFSESMKGHPQGGPQSMPTAQAVAVAGNGTVVKEEGGTGNEKRRKQNGQSMAPEKPVRTEAVIANGHDIHSLAGSLPGSSRKKHKKRGNIESHPV